MPDRGDRLDVEPVDDFTRMGDDPVPGYANPGRLVREVEELGEAAGGSGVERAQAVEAGETYAAHVASLRSAAVATRTSRSVTEALMTLASVDEEVQLHEEQARLAEKQEPKDRKRVEELATRREQHEERLRDEEKAFDERPAAERIPVPAALALGLPFAVHVWEPFALSAQLGLATTLANPTVVWLLCTAVPVALGAADLAGAFILAMLWHTLAADRRPSLLAILAGAFVFSLLVVTGTLLMFRSAAEEVAGGEGGVATSLIFLGPLMLLASTSGIAIAFPWVLRVMSVEPVVRWQRRVAESGEAEGAARRGLEHTRGEIRRFWAAAGRARVDGKRAAASGFADLQHLIPRIAAEVALGRLLGSRYRHAYDVAAARRAERRSRSRRPFLGAITGVLLATAIEGLGVPLVVSVCFGGLGALLVTYAPPVRLRAQWRLGRGGPQGVTPGGAVPGGAPESTNGQLRRQNRARR